MSNPTNQLAKYRSYSYYHVLVICDSSQTASKLSEIETQDAWQHADKVDHNKQGDVKSLGKYSIKTLPDGGKYCVLINGSVDADFTITKTSWQSLTAASATMNDRNTSIALEGNISISEPRGIIFLDQVVRCCLALGVDSANAFWALKTFFVGYNYDISSDTDSVDHITDIPPVIFLAYDVTGTFGLAGGEYEINFVAGANSASRLPHFSKAANSVNIQAGGTLAGTLSKLFEEINKNYKQYYNCVKEQVSKIEGGKDLQQSLREVTYTVECGYPYANADGSANPYYTVTDQSSQSKSIVGCDQPAMVSVSAGVSIEDAIHRILGMSSEVKSEASVGVNNVKYITKIQSWVASAPTSTDSNELTFTVGYRVIRQEQPRSVSFDSYNSGEVGKADPNVIEFDYIYTGKNIDILEFDIKMNMGMVYLQGMTISNPYKQPGQTISTTSSSVAAQDLAGRWDGANIPVFFGTKIKTSGIRDTNNTQTSAQHAYSMSKHASLEMLEAKVKITGNSQLLGSINSTSSPENIRDQKKTVQDNDNYAKYSNWGLSPSFAKINIMMPRSNDDKSLYTGIQTSEDDFESNDYAINFWFTGYYYVYGIEHVFENGEFFQVLDALGIPEKNSFRTEQSTSQQNDINLDTAIQSCYEPYIGCGSTNQSGGTEKQPPVVLPEQTDSVNKPEVKQAIVEQLPATPTELSNIVGYDKASPEVKRAIHNAAVNNGVDEVALAQMCAVESKFDPLAEYHKKGQPPNPKGAKGLFQFVGGTWDAYGGGDRFDPELNADRGAKYFKENQIGLKKALGRDPTPSEIYLAHNQGLGGATGVLKKVDAGNGHLQAKLNNPVGNNIKDTTANGAALWAQQIMGSRLKNGAPFQTNNALPTTVPTSAPTAQRAQPRKNQQALAGSISCTDEDKKQKDDTKKPCQVVPTQDAVVAQSPIGNATPTPELVSSSLASPIAGTFGHATSSLSELATAANKANSAAEIAQTAASTLGDWATQKSPLLKDLITPTTK